MRKWKSFIKNNKKKEIKGYVNKKSKMKIDKLNWIEENQKN